MNGDKIREYQREAHRRLRERRKAEGKCLFCEEPRAEGYTTCLVHLERQRARRVTKRSDHQCYMCEEPAMPGTSFCEQHLTYRRRQEREHEAGWRRQAELALGGKCVCCGEAESAFLVIDHADDNGAEDRRRLGRQLKAKEFRLIVDGKYPYRVQLLCANCNTARARYGVCPHQK